MNKILQLSSLALLLGTALWVIACTTPTQAPAPLQQPTPSTGHLPKSHKVNVSPIDSPTSPTETLQGTQAASGELEEYNALHRLYASQKCIEAVPGFEKFESLHPQSNYLSQVENLHGLCELFMRDPKNAVGHFKNSIAANRTNPSYAPYLSYNLAQSQLEAGQLQDARDTLAKISASGQESAMDADNRAKLDLLKTAVANAQLGAAAPPLTDAPIERKKVGILLPLKGKYGKFARKNLDAIELALGVFGQASDSGVTLVIEDSGEEGDTAVKALGRLVTDHHVSAVIGPLLSKGIDQVSKRANELGVPLLSLARYTGMPAAVSGDNYMIQAGVTSELQAKEIARYAVQTLGLRKFAILYPKGKAGEESAQSFWQTAEQLGGQVTGIESYGADETDFRQVVDKLSGLYYTEARQRELDQLAKLRTENKIKKRNRKTEQYYSLPPIADYQAVFIPDDPKMAGMIIPTFAYRDVDHVTYLGTSSWDSPELAASAQNYAEGALFVDSFFPQSPAKNVQNFIGSYRAEFGQDPGAMEAIAYDAANALNQAIHESSSNFSRKDLLNQLRDTKNLAGITGKLTYKNGQFDRDLKVLALRNGQIVEDSK